MNTKAKQHLVKAGSFIARGEDYYRKAATAIVSAKEADPSLTNHEIGEYLGYSGKWVQKLIAWVTSDSAPSTPFVEPKRETPDVRGARRVLAEASPEQVEKIIDSLPTERKRVVRVALNKHSVDPAPRTDPTFIDLIVKASNTLIELRSLLARCEDASGIPPEFSEASMDDIAAKAMQIKEMVVALRSDSNDEWQRIVSELREA